MSKKIRDGNVIKKFWKTVLAMISLTIVSIIFSRAVSSMTTSDLAQWIGSLTGGMPSLVVKGSTGYMPQGINGAGVAYCNDQGSIVRNGAVDYKTYYPDADGVNVFTWDQLIQKMRDAVNNKSSSISAPQGSRTDYSDHYDETYWVETSRNFSSNEDEVKAVLSQEDGWTVIAVIDSPYSIGPYIDNVMSAEMSEINAMLSAKKNKTHQ